MSTINQNSLLNSIHEALVPGASLIDGRTEQDWLRFLSDFAALINFYDHDNTVQGNWAPFMLKDPVFLMAVVSKTEFARLHALYLSTCYKLEQLLLSLSNQKDLPISFNELFDQIIRIFIKIKQWTWYMVRSAVEYPLKTYVTGQIRTTFANLLQAIFTLRQDLFSSLMIIGLAPTDPLLVAEFEGYEERIWKQSEFKYAYWELMGLLHPVKANSLTAIFKALTNAGDTLFNFLQVIIKQADIEFIRLTKIKSSHPDTTLLRTFINLLKIQQDQLNQISAKHLNFYYKNILKQEARTAIADSAYLIAGLVKKDAVLNLPAGTLFDGGIDAQKNPVVFESTEDVVLNPAVIPMAYTLSRIPASDGFSALQLQTITNPGVVKKDADGKVQSWDTLGSSVPFPDAQQPLAIAFASPMLLLREGTREIKLSLSFAGEADLKLLQQASCYLSTLTVWLAVTADVQLAGPSQANTVVMTITLKNTDPPIECFLSNPDGIEGSWPMFKLVFNKITVADVPPPVLQSMQIDVTVSGVETFQLYNDFGALSTKVAFPPFGPSPLVGSDFIMGSTEIFSKPVCSLQLKLNWSLLPLDFAVYYKSYNLYLNNQLRISKAPDDSWWDKIFHKKKTAEPVVVQDTAPYNNTCFTIDFQVLEEQSWTPVVFNTVNPATAQSVLSASAAGSNLLFLEENKQLSAFISYATTAIPVTACDPSLQNQPMKFTEISTAGFIRMELKGPDDGFGSGLYPNVVSAITLYNSQILYNKEEVAFADPVQLPFTPKLKSFSADYTASVKYIFDQEKEDQTTPKDYPIQCYLYTPFVNYPVYDTQNQPKVQEYTIGGSDSTENASSGVPLYASFNYDGFLYLQIDNLVPASSFNLYFELARKYVPGKLPNNKVGYYCLCNTGWEPLIVSSDGTDKLTFSGIVTVNIPATITMESDLMPARSYWIAIVATPVASVANTVLLSTNGIGVQRTGTAISGAATIPAIAAHAITKTKTPVPQISTVQQPFSSFGGKAAEDIRSMNQRISSRLKTKDRAVTAMDYFSLIRLEFNDIYDAMSIYDSAQQKTIVYVVKSVEAWTDPNAFLPMVSSSQEKQIGKFLQKRTSAFSVISVANPEFQPINVYVTVTIQTGYEFSAVQQRIIQALNIYLSPWITSSVAQTEIYQDITDVQLSAFIKTITGVSTVERVSFKTYMYNTAAATALQTAPLQQTVIPLKKAVLFISGMDHKISQNSSAK